MRRRLFDVFRVPGLNERFRFEDDVHGLPLDLRGDPDARDVLLRKRRRFAAQIREFAAADKPDRCENDEEYSKPRRKLHSDPEIPHCASSLRFGYVRRPRPKRNATASENI